MNTPDMSQCCTCGYRWPTGQSGRHICAQHMAATIARLTAEHIEDQGVIAVWRGRCQRAEDALEAARAEVEALRFVPLTDDMLRYAMAALGTGSPREAERFRAFWLHAMSARKAPATPTGSGS